MTPLPDVGVAGAVPVVWEVPLAWDPVSESSPSSPSLLSVLSPVGVFLLKSWRVRLDRGWFSWSRLLFTVSWIFSYKKSKCGFYKGKKSCISQLTVESLEFEVAQFSWYSRVALSNEFKSLTKINYWKSLFSYWNEKPTHPRNYIPMKQKTDNPRKLAPTNLNDSTVIIMEVFNGYHIIRENGLLAYFTIFNLCMLPRHCDFAPRHFKLCKIITFMKCFNLLDMAFI